MKIIFINGGRVDNRFLFQPHDHPISGTDAIVEAGEVMNVLPEYAANLIADRVAKPILAPSKKMISVSLRMEGNSDV